MSGTNPLFGPRKPVKYTEAQIQEFTAPVEVPVEVPVEEPTSTASPRPYTSAQKAIVMQGYALAKTKAEKEALLKSAGIAPSSTSKLYNLASKLGATGKRP